MYSLKESSDYISFEKIPSSWKKCFKNIKKHYQIDWLDNYNYNEILSYYEFDEQFKQRFYQEINALKNDNQLNFICYIMYYILFFADEKNFYDIWSWKKTLLTFHKNGSFMIPVVALLCGYEIHISNIKSRKFDKKQIKSQKNNIRLTCTSDKTKYFIDGIRFSQMIWGSYFIKGNLIQIGRLQYEIFAKKNNQLNEYFQYNPEYIYIHIPREKHLKEEDVDASLKDSDKYIKKYYPELKNKKLVYYTKTW